MHVLKHLPYLEFIVARIKTNHQLQTRKRQPYRLLAVITIHYFIFKLSREILFNAHPTTSVTWGNDADALSAIVSY